MELEMEAGREGGSVSSSVGKAATEMWEQVLQQVRALQDQVWGWQVQPDHRDGEEDERSPVLLLPPPPVMASVLSAAFFIVIWSAKCVFSWRRRRRRRRTLDSPSSGVGEDKGCVVPEESLAKSSRKREVGDAVAARFANACLEVLFDSKSDSPRRGFLAGWLRGANAALERENSNSDFSLHFVDIPLIATPELKDAAAKWTEGEASLVADLSISTVHLSLTKFSGDLRSEYFLMVDDFAAELTARTEKGGDSIALSSSLRGRSPPLFRLVSRTQEAEAAEGDDGLDASVFHRATSAFLQAGFAAPLSCMGMEHPAAEKVNNTNSNKSRRSRPPRTSSTLPPAAVPTLTASDLAVTTLGRRPKHVYAEVRLELEDEKKGRPSKKQTWMADDEKEEEEGRFSWRGRAFDFPLSEDPSASHLLSVEVFDEFSKRRSIGKFTTLVQVPEVANVQEFVAPMTAVAGSSTKAELTIKLCVHGGKLGRPSSTPLATGSGSKSSRELSRANSTNSQQQQQQHRHRRNFDSSSYVCHRSLGETGGKHTVSNVALSHLRQKRGGGGEPIIFDPNARSVLTISTVSKVPKEPNSSRDSSLEKSNKSASAANSSNSCGRRTRMSMCGGRPVMCQRRIRTVSNSSTMSSSSSPSTCSDCSLEVEADLSGWRGWVGGSWGEDLQKEEEARKDLEEEKVEGRKNRLLSLQPESTNSSIRRRRATNGMNGSARFGSTLVLETAGGELHLGDGLSRAERKRLAREATANGGGKKKKKGAQLVKLHVVKGHAFNAKHVKGGTKCWVCRSSIFPFPGKQAYVCRDCGSVVHKRCHASVTEECPNASVTVPEEDEGEEEESEINTET